MNNIIENLINTEINRERQSGYTTNLVSLVKNMNGTLFCHSEKEAKRVRDEFNIKAVSVSSNTQGMKGPYFWDSTAFVAVHSEVMYELEQKDKKIKELEVQLKKRVKEFDLIEAKIKEVVGILGYESYY